MPPAENLPPQPEVRFARRAFKMDPWVLRKYGFTKGCAACEASRAGRKSHGVPHEQRCRSRIEEKMMKNKDDETKLAESKKRMKENEQERKKAQEEDEKQE